MENVQPMPAKQFAPVRTALYYCQRLVTSSVLRNAAVRVISAVIARTHGKTASNAPCGSHHTALRKLREEGIAPLGSLLSTVQCTDIHAFLRNKTRHSANEMACAPASERAEIAAPGDYRLDDIVCCPHIMDLANNRTLLALASDYLGCKPTISAIRLAWAFPRDGADLAAPGFHRDSDDLKYFKVLVYLTGITRDDGAHIYIKKSHLDRSPLFRHGIVDQPIDARTIAERVMIASGGEGEGFAVDTAGIHKDNDSLTRPCLTLQIQYSLLPCFAIRYAPVAHPSYLDFDPYINRLLLRRKRRLLKVRHSYRSRFP